MRDAGRACPGTPPSAHPAAGNAPTRLGILDARWWRILGGGYILFVIVSHVVRWTGILNLVPTELLLGSFLVPVSFVYFLYENGTFAQMPATAVAGAFVLGGVLGVSAAGILEAGFGQVVLVGFIEEAAKILGVIWWLGSAELRGEGGGIVLGAAAGMGFSALETMGYGLSSLLTPNGFDPSSMVSELMARGVLSPLGHGTWTAILAGTMWREKAAGRSPFGRPVLKAYVTVAVLHGLWDLADSSPALSRLSIHLPFVQLPVSSLLIGGVGLYILRGMVLRSRRGPDPVAA